MYRKLSWDSFVKHGWKWPAIKFEHLISIWISIWKMVSGRMMPLRYVYFHGICFQPSTRVRPHRLCVPMVAVSPWGGAVTSTTTVRITQMNRTAVSSGFPQFKYYADAIHSAINPLLIAINNSWSAGITKAEVTPSVCTPLSPSLCTPHQILYSPALKLVFRVELVWFNDLS